MGGFQLTEVVKNLIIINVLMFIGTMVLLENPTEVLGITLHRGMLAMFYPASEAFHPVQIVTHLFMHADLHHLFFNMFSLFMFGPELERRFGPKRFLFFYLSCGLFAFLLHMLVLTIEINYLGTASINSSIWGASGAIFGVLVGFAVLNPDRKIMLLIPPIPMKAKYLIGLVVIFELFSGVVGYGSQIAHFAHLGGGIGGAALIYYWRKQGLV